MSGALEPTDEPGFRTLKRALFVAALLTNGLLLWHFHDRYWYPTDDGLYAHVAQRLLEGEVLNRDIQDIHPGYIHMLHAAAFRLFGVDLVSLRYPLVAAAFAQAVLVFALLRRRDLVLATVGSLASTALGVIQFVSPTSNWYCMSLTVALAWWMIRVPVGHPTRLLGAGMLLGVLGLFRHLSGVWVAMAVLVLAMLEHAGDGRARSRLFARALLLTMLAALLGYLVLSPGTDLGGVLLIAVWPMAILIWLLAHVRTTNAEVMRFLAPIGAGVALSALPLVLYHALHGSLGVWVGDVVFAAAGETQMDFFGGGWYGVLSLAGFYQAVSSADPVKIVNGLYWSVLPMFSAVNGYLVLRNLRLGTDPRELLLPLLASFYALVSLYLGDPLYLYYSAGLSLVALLWTMRSSSRIPRFVWASAVTAVTVIAIVFHAGQSRRRTPVQILEGHRDSNVWAGGHLGLDRATLRIDRADRETYGRLVSLIQDQTEPSDSLLALPQRYGAVLPGQPPKRVPLLQVRTGTSDQRRRG